MKRKLFRIVITTVLILIYLPLQVKSQTKEKIPSTSEPQIQKLKNPISISYLKKNLEKKSPRLVLNSRIEKQLRQKLKTDSVVKNMYEAIALNAKAIQKAPLLERKLEGRRLLSVSREMLYRMNMLGMLYRIEHDPQILNRINQELITVCNFDDWNPAHFLDVAEMALAVAIAVDWAGDDLPTSTVALAQSALIEKAIRPSYGTEHDVLWWINTSNNWNQVCHGGLIAASIVIAEKDPELASKTIYRALENIPLALEAYRPDGVYPEGPTYWGYGTSFTVITASMLESAFGTDFGIAAYPSFKESADFKLLSISPSGRYYNFGDNGDRRSKKGDMTLAWFAAKTGNALYFERERFLIPPAEMEKLSRLDGAGLVWLTQYEEDSRQELPVAWKGEGENPVIFFRGGENDSHQFYLGAKGGGGVVNHGNMDGGSFVFELNGFLWSLDPGNQAYNELEQTGFDLWSNCQDCDRWKLLSKNNFGHSTLTVNQQLHVANGLAVLEDFKDGDQPEATFNLTPCLEGQLSSARRKFIKDSPGSLRIEDQLELNDSTASITWQMMTTAEVEITKGGALLTEAGQVLKLQNLSHPDFAVSVVSLDPPPLPLDKKISGLKRIEITLPANAFKAGKGTLKIRLSGK